MVTEQLIRKFEDEINIYCRSLNFINDAIKRHNIFATYNILRNIYINVGEFDENIIEIIHNFINTGLLSPLTLNEDEFVEEERDEDNILISKVNKRCNYIKLDYLANDTYKIRNENAWIPIINKIYDCDTKLEITDKVMSNKIQIPTPNKNKLYIEKNGIMTGEFIEECYIKEKTNYIPPKPIKITVSIIVAGNKSYYIVNNNNSNLKELESNYNVYKYNNGFIGGLYNINNYKNKK